MILAEKTLAGKASQKKLAKSVFGRFISMENYTQLLFIKCIQQSQN
jgi:hypothetical protein